MTKKSVLKRVVALFSACVLVFGVMPHITLNAFAAGTHLTVVDAWDSSSIPAVTIQYFEGAEEKELADLVDGGNYTANVSAADYTGQNDVPVTVSGGRVEGIVALVPSSYSVNSWGETSVLFAPGETVRLEGPGSAAITTSTGKTYEYQYAWSTGATTKQISVGVANTYTLTVFAPGETTVGSQVYTVTANAALSIAQPGSIEKAWNNVIPGSTTITDPIVNNFRGTPVAGSWAYTSSDPLVASVAGNTIQINQEGIAHITGSFIPENSEYSANAPADAYIGSIQAGPVALNDSGFAVISGIRVYSQNAGVSFWVGGTGLPVESVKIEVFDEENTLVPGAWVWNSVAQAGTDIGTVSEDTWQGPSSGRVDIDGYLNKNVLENGTFTVVATAVINGQPVQLELARLGFDTTAPIIAYRFVDHGDTPVQNPVNGVYYFGTRTLEITVDETHYDPQTSRSFVLDLTKNGTPVSAADGEWTSEGGTRHTWAYNLTAGSYAFASATAKDLPGNANSFLVTVPGDKAFVIDEGVPTVAGLTFDDGVAGKYHKAGVSATLSIQEENVSLEALNTGNYANITLTKNGTAIPFEQVWQAGAESDTYSLLLNTETLRANASYVLTAVVYDFSGNPSEEKTYTFVVDGTAPRVMVEYAPATGTIFGDYFNTTRRLKITVEDTYLTDSAIFFPSSGTSDIRFGVFNLQVKTSEEAEPYNISIDQLTYEAASSTATKIVLSYDMPPDAIYSFSCEVSDLAGNKNTEYNSAYIFYADQTPPVAIIREVTTQTVWQQFLSIITFGLFSNSSLEIELSGQDALSGVGRMDYIASPTPIVGDTQEELVAALDAHGWTAAAFTLREGVAIASIPHEEEAKFFYYLRVTDKANNVSYCLSQGIIIDKTQVVEITRPEVTLAPGQQPVNGIYNTDVKVLIDATDPASGLDGVFSGLAEVKYSVQNLGVETQSGVLYSTGEEAVSWQEIVDSQTMEQKTITVDAALNNSNSVVVEVTATDRAGNVAISRVTLKIDTTPPSVTVSYDNNSAQNGKYFNRGRTATVSVAERNFDPAATQITTNGSIGEWKLADAGTGNGDNCLWVAAVTFAADNAYTFEVRTADLAGNAASAADYGSSTAPNAFVVDTTKPIITVTYNNNDVRNNRYYNAARTATITIAESNFAAGDVRVAITSTGNVPGVGGWSSSGSSHTAAIQYTQDAAYTFSVEYTDLAGNTADAGIRHEFTIDTVAPKVEITGVEDLSANNGDVIPVLTFTDENFDYGGTKVLLTGSAHGATEAPGAYARIARGSVFTFANFAKTPQMDDMYTLVGSVTDLAGNSAQVQRFFSVNRYGSVYEFLNGTAEVVAKGYVGEAPDLTIRETNVDTLEFKEITVSRDGEVVTLEEGKDYSVEKAPKGEWSQYTYTVYSASFEQEGMYTVTVYSEDRATNTTSNRTTKKEAAKPIDFIVDRTAPTNVVTGIEEGGRYAEQSRLVMVNTEDNVALEKLEIYLNDDASTPVATYNAEEIAEKNGIVDFTVYAQNATQTLRVVSYDKAGNVSGETTVSFLLTTNLFIQYINNVPLLIISFAGVAGVAVLIWRASSAGRRKKRQEAEE